jgi:hypothetical protein
MTKITERLTDLAKRARKVSDEMCHNSRWRMSIPPQSNDSDMLIYELAETAEEAATLIAALSPRSEGTTPAPATPHLNLRLHALMAKWRESDAPAAVLAGYDETCNTYEVCANELEALAAGCAPTIEPAPDVKGIDAFVAELHENHYAPAGIKTVLLAFAAHVRRQSSSHGAVPARSCCEPAPDRSGRSCDKPQGHDGDHWTYGGTTLTWAAPGAVPEARPHETIRELIQAAQNTADFLKACEWNDRTSETDASNLAQRLQDAVTAIEVAEARSPVPAPQDTHDGE